MVGENVGKITGEFPYTKGVKYRLSSDVDAKR